MKKHCLLWLTYSLFGIVPSLVQAQKTTNYDLASLLEQKKLTVYNRTIYLSDDKMAVKLNEKDREGIVWLNGITFGNGTIEIDLKGKDVLQRSFLGVAFHGVNDSTYDAVYFRPFNFHAKDSIRRIHAVQYISHPVYTWSKLREERNGVYEKAVISPPDPNNWFHARIEVVGETVQVYVNDVKTASLTIKKLNDRKDGKIGLWVGDGSDGEFKNLKITRR
ncbi:DUF1080 domain-containing protein [Cytophagaceae bacterium DM2B3-1]|uniref:DUF1080 domain-containing protein n=1 Tax=Xanthocytophaga flava TaxID=3048013 RepID=A0ABT7CJB4_9BACT|nr:family 16 glycoside hydrolase [Xanthocytophaga flavus]MDJ1493795.1 DUF1080 domain-containing protein [Xanthocytophaga flavus]